MTLLAEVARCEACFQFQFYDPDLRSSTALLNTRMNISQAWTGIPVPRLKVSSELLDLDIRGGLNELTKSWGTTTIFSALMLVVPPIHCGCC